MFSPETEIPKPYILCSIAKCDLCGCCVGVCPEDAIELSETVLSIIISRCTCCVKCVWSCPVEALELIRISK